ncbi:MAG TPA: SDR family NAD(P)-dependent oxidoreductase [Pyrinomonadaceae bacterium]|nr:SDR family NAD(P)-dependent oxidoreductase [Pyrinomonadaceae bacterium]
MILAESLNLQGRVALVTGGARGIGRAICLRLAEAGVHVGINYLQAQGAAEETAQAVRAQGVEALTLRADVGRPVEAATLVQRLAEKFGRLDILVCNAGVWAGAPIEEMDEELWDSVLAANLKGAWAVCRAAVPLLKRQQFGRIVINSSTAGQRGEANYANYAAAKGGQLSLTKSLAAELAPHGITVNAVAPGWVDTEMIAGVTNEAERRAEIVRTIPLGRLATPEDVAWPVLFLCSEWARHITGAVLNVNGGSVLCD